MVENQTRRTGTREAVLDAALGVFTEKGYAAAGIEDIRRALRGQRRQHLPPLRGQGADRGGPVRPWARGLSRRAARRSGAEPRRRSGNQGDRPPPPPMGRIRAGAGRLPDESPRDGGRGGERGARPRASTARPSRGSPSGRPSRSAADALNGLPLDLLLAIALGPAQEFARHLLAGRARARWPGPSARSARRRGPLCALSPAPVPSAAARRSSGAAR